MVWGREGDGCLTGLTTGSKLTLRFDIKGVFWAGFCLFGPRKREWVGVLYGLDLVFGIINIKGSGLV